MLPVRPIQKTNDMISIKKIVSYILIGIVLVFTITAILGIWGLITIDIQRVMLRTLYSLLVIFAASAVLLFIFNILLNNERKEE